MIRSGSFTGGTAAPSQDDDIRRDLWTGALPIVFSLTPNEVTVPQAQAPHSFYALIPRGSYFPMCTAAVCKHFSASAPVLGDEMWLEYKGKSIKWHYPVGVLFDLLCGQTELPWTVTVHFQGFPHDQLLRCPGEETVKSHFYNVFKEANYAKYGDGARVNSLSVAAFNGLWEGVKSGEFQVYSSSVSKLSSDTSAIKHLPVRILLPNPPSSSTPFTCIQEPFSPLSPGEGSSPLTLGQALHDTLPTLFPNPTRNDDVDWLVQGLHPSLDTPLAWLADTACHPDNFLYIVLKPASLSH